MFCARSFIVPRNTLRATRDNESNKSEGGHSVSDKISASLHNRRVDALQTPLLSATQEPCLHVRDENKIENCQTNYYSMLCCRLDQAMARQQDQVNFTSLNDPWPNLCNMNEHEVGGNTKHSLTPSACTDALLLPINKTTPISATDPSDIISWRKDSLELLLSPPEESNSSHHEVLRTTKAQTSYGRTLSLSSLPSFDNSILTADDVCRSACRRRTSVSRRTPSQALKSSVLVGDNHPLFTTNISFEDLDFRVFNIPSKAKSSTTPSQNTWSRKSAFKAHLMASLRALKMAATSISNLTTPILMPEDFLTRSILTIDPQLPYTDECMPALQNGHPPVALRRYLNPPVNAMLTMSPSVILGPKLNHKCATSIQMHTYKVHHEDRRMDARERLVEQQPNSMVKSNRNTFPIRQREMRENGDFIRIAVMEMAMRRNGKLDDQTPGRARWVLPPRQDLKKPQGYGHDGVPTRWSLVVA